MSQALWKLFLLTMVVSLVVACAPTAVPTAIPTKAPVAPPAVAPTLTVAPVATPKPVAPTPTPAPKIKRGGTLREASKTYPTMDPHLSNASTLAGYRMMCDALFRYELIDEKTAQHQLEGELVESWQIVDPKTFVFKLRKGVKFHDGSAWDAEVAKFNIERMLTHKKSTARTYVEDIKSVEVVDQSTVRINLTSSSAAFLVKLSGADGATSIVSKAAVEKLGDEGFHNKPVCSGAMEFVEWVPDERLTLRKFEGYWRSGVDGKLLPYLDRYVFRVILDPSVVLLELKAGTVDIQYNPEAKDVASIKANPEFVYWGHPASVVVRNVGSNPKTGPFADNLKLRQATLWAIDRESMVKTLTFGLGKIYRQANWVPGHLGYDETLPYYDYDVNKAKQALGEAGYPNGIDIALIAMARPLEIRTGEILKQMWDNVGIRTTIDSPDRLAWHSKVRGYNFEIAHWSNTAGPDADFNSVFFTTGGVSNYTGWNDPRMDKCMVEGRSTYDPKERHEIYKRCQRIIHEEAYVAGLFYWTAGWVHHRSVKGVKTQWIMLDPREIWLDK